MNTSSNSTDAAIIFFLNGNNGVNANEIKINNDQTDTLVLTLQEEHKGSKCCGPLFLITSTKYNSKPKECLTKFK